jgi:hypothetical protein
MGLGLFVLAEDAGEFWPESSGIDTEISPPIGLLTL